MTLLYQVNDLQKFVRIINLFFFYSSYLVAEDSTDCPPCDCGLYCDSPGLTAPRGQCDPGFLCYGGAYTSGPTDGVTGDYCTAGGYCEAGKQILHLCQYLTT